MYALSIYRLARVEVSFSKLKFRSSILCKASDSTEYLKKICPDKLILLMITNRYRRMNLVKGDKGEGGKEDFKSDIHIGSYVNQNNACSCFQNQKFLAFL
jgi:hypothetical protein